MEAVAAAVRFFAPGVEIIQIPAWDCLPYDRVSPNSEVMSQRVAGLHRLSVMAEGTPVLVLATVNSVLQRLPPRSFFAESARAYKLGDTVELKDLTGFFDRNGYLRSDTVREAGEYAIRGGILDVFPSGAEEPSRLDFFGDDLEEIRTFDPMSQRTTGKLDNVEFKPVGELILDQGSIQRFRNGYRSRFGGEVGNDPIYEAVSAGRKHAGMEHWLPLFHDGLETLFDYAPVSEIFLDHQAGEVAEARFEQIAEYFDARDQALSNGLNDGSATYRPLPSDALYQSRAEWAEALDERYGGDFMPFAAPADEDGRGGGLADFGGKPALSFAEARNLPDVNVYDAVGDAIAAQQSDGRKVLIAAYTAGSMDRLIGLLNDHGLEHVTVCDNWKAVTKLKGDTFGAAVLPLENGFVSEGLTIITEQDIIGERLVRPSRRKRRGEDFLRDASTLIEGDFVVHVEHGIGRYEGLETLEIGNAPHDCLRLVYSGDDKLFLPVENIEVLSRYGSEDSNAQLDKLGGVAWQARKAAVKKRIRDIAEQLIRIAASRQITRNEPMIPPEGVFEEFCARFPFSETDDQLRAIDETLGDLAEGKPMDRLVCGDVGFGKTEVALRTAFAVAMQGYQVAIVAPTTLLARQHAITFRERFKGFPVRVGHLSRLVTAKDAALTKAELAAGDCNIVIGTHALLAKSISFNNLGLIIVDEEQHFGVTQKERLKELRSEVHVLTLTATPIPRTLQMALTGVRDMSLIATPPVDRLAVRTFVMPYDGVVIREAIMREHFRGGQTFYVCPRVEDLSRVHERLTKLVPEVKLEVAHGRMSPNELEGVMTRFVDGAFDVLLSTNIVESGLDIPSANTIVIHRSDMFGLAQLYQLRGRVGRSKTRAYAYLTTHPSKVLTPTAQRRLEVMQTLDSLGAGFSLASHDMDIRGAGNLLGDEQSGQVREVGIELYQHLLQEAVEAAKEGVAPGEERQSDWTPQIQLGTPVLIPDSYVPDLSVRMNLYRRIASLVDQDELESFAAEMVDRFGKLPDEVENLLRVIAIKQLCRSANVEKADAGPKGAVITFRNNDFANPGGLVEFMARQAGTVQLRPDHKLVYRRPWNKPQERVRGLTKLMQELVAIAV